MKRVVSLVLLLTTLCLLCACDKYTSSYRALGLVRTESTHSCEVSFHSLNGRIVYRLKKTDQGAEGDIAYSIRVEKGEVRLSYDIYGVKEELACVKAGEEISERGGYIEGGKTVYIILEATEGSRGRVSVELNS